MMNTVVFVLMVSVGTARSGWVPTIEFNSEEKCNAAVKVLYTELDRRLSMGGPIMPWCMRVEK